MAKGKLTEQNKAEIRRLYADEGYTQDSLAVLYGVSKRTIIRVLNPEYYARELQRSIEYQRKNKTKIRQHRLDTRKDYFLSYSTERDAAVIEKLDAQENIQDYIRTLVTDDISKDNKSK